MFATLWVCWDFVVFAIVIIQDFVILVNLAFLVGGVFGYFWVWCFVFVSGYLV